MRRGRGPRGGALVAALATLAFAAALGATLADLVRTELRLASERRLAARLLAALDGCVADVVADLRAGWDFAAEVAGADATHGTTDDGILPSPTGCDARARRAPGGAQPDRTLVRVETRIGPARRRLDALVRRAPAAGAGALLWLSAPPDAGAVTGLATIDGGGADAPLASLAAPADPDALDTWVVGAASVLEVSPDTLAPVSASAPPLADLGARVLAAPHASAGVLATTETPIPGLAHVAGDLAVDDARRGAGLLFVDGSLVVRGALAFHGVIAAAGGLRIAPGASLTLDGSLWLGMGSPTLAVEGTLVLRHDPGALAEADALLPLPRRAIVAGTRDIG